jgi:AraC-like DNA-binding protein
MNKDCAITKIYSVLLFKASMAEEHFSSFRASLKYNELILHLTGNITVDFNDKTFPCPKGTLRYLPKGEHKTYAVTRHEPADCIDIFFDTDIPFFEEAFCINVQNNVSIQALFNKAVSVWLTKNEGYYHKCLSIIYEIFAELEKQRYMPENKFKVIEPAVEFINENFSKDKISVEHLAEISGISQSYLKKLFLKRFGVTPIKYIIQLKLNYTADLLKTGMYTVSQVSEVCGYNNVYFFSRQFKQQFGVSPSQFAEKFISLK